jgi:hypothetical protein
MLSSWMTSQADIFSINLRMAITLDKAKNFKFHREQEISRASPSPSACDSPPHTNTRAIEVEIESNANDGPIKI